MNTIKSISYIVRECKTGFCIIEHITLSNGKAHQRSLKHGLEQANAQNIADNWQARFEGWGYRPAE
jgi:hypothetical protein